jgi:hypothetical protein
VAPPVVGKEVAFEPRDVYSHGTFRLAGAALEAQIQRSKDAFVAETGLAETARHRQPKDIRTSSRRIHLVASGHI